jgi:hypothetical protein
MRMVWRVVRWPDEWWPEWRDVLGDGTCMYRAIAVGVGGTEDQWQAHKETALMALEARRADYEWEVVASNEGPWSRYVAHHSEHWDAWGDERLLSCWALASGAMLLVRDPEGHAAVGVAGDVASPPELLVCLSTSGTHYNVARWRDNDQLAQTRGRAWSASAWGSAIPRVSGGTAGCRRGGIRGGRPRRTARWFENGS